MHLMPTRTSWASRGNEVDYEVTLAAQPWKSCPCEVCADAGIQVAIFRGTERNKRRGFHNLHVFNRRLQDELAAVA